jgi:hypothetical protein
VMHNKSGLINKSKTIFNIYSKPTYLFFGIAIIFLLLASLLCVCRQYDNVVTLPSHAQAETSSNSLTDRNVFIKTAISSTSSDSNNSYTPFTSNMTLPPRIVMTYNGMQHPDVLVSYKYRHGYTFGQLDIPAKKVTTSLPSDVVNIKKGSSVQFIAKGTPPILSPSSMSIDVYTSQGEPVNVLNTTKSTSSAVALNLSEGKYILLATATWLPRNEDVTGYAIFSYMINIVPW